jgi:thiol-disulfide isomerase/thioredoxin
MSEKGFLSSCTTACQRTLLTRPRMAALLCASLTGARAFAPALPSASSRTTLGPPAPELTSTSWLNAPSPLRLAQLRGRVVLLNFWVFTCGNCTRTVPSLVSFDRTYRERGLTIIGIHTPEFPPYGGEHDKGNLARALARQGIAYPNAQDNDRRIWSAYGIRYWPSFVLIDRRGTIRYSGYGEFHVGDADFRLWEQRIAELLAE